MTDEIDVAIPLGAGLPGRDMRQSVASPFSSPRLIVGAAERIGIESVHLVIARIEHGGGRMPIPSDRDPSEREFDALIVGAGPAGSEAAYQLASRGYRVIVLERDRLDREKACGGGIQLKELLEFGQLPAAVTERRIRRAVFISPACHQLEVTGRNRRLFTVTVRRAVYDRYLQQRAEAAGAIVLPHARVSGVETSLGRRPLRRVEVDVEGRPVTFTARLVVNAGGAAARGVTRMLGIDEKPEEMCVTQHHWLRIPRVEEHFSDCIELYFIRECHEGYVWIFPKRDVLSVGIGTTASSVRQRGLNLQSLLGEFIASHPVAGPKLRGHEIVQSGGGAIPMGPLGRIAAPGAIIVGDAAGLGNLIHGGGIYQARKSALIAAPHCAAFLEDGQQQHLQAYDAEAHDFFYNYEEKWDRKIRTMLWNDRSVDWLVERGADRPRVQEALGILLTSEHSHQRAYTTLEAEMVDLVYDELTRMASDYRREINARLESLLGDQSPLQAHANEVLLSDGAKRFRAYLFVLAAEMFSVDHETAVNLSTIYELFHAASLVHDDIMDGANRRRGQSTLHKKYGVAEAIIAGDLMILKAFEVIARDGATLSRAQLDGLLRVIGETGEKCCLGQSLDMELARERRYTSANAYQRMVELKTGSLVEGAVQGGALLGAPSAVQMERVGRLGCRMGAAFQIVDDSLDLIGANANKSVRNDLKQAKATPMLIHALSVVGPADRELLLRAVGNKRLGAKAAAEVAELYHRCGAVQFAQKLSLEYVDAARDALRGLPDGDARRSFEQVLDILGCWGMLAESAEEDAVDPARLPRRRTG